MEGIVFTSHLHLTFPAFLHFTKANNAPKMIIGYGIKTNDARVGCEIIGNAQEIKDQLTQRTSLTCSSSFPLRSQTPPSFIPEFLLG